MKMFRNISGQHLEYKNQYKGHISAHTKANEYPLCRIEFRRDSCYESLSNLYILTHMREHHIHMVNTTISLNHGSIMYL